MCRGELAVDGCLERCNTWPRRRPRDTGFIHSITYVPDAIGLLVRPCLPTPLLRHPSPRVSSHSTPER